MHDFHMHTTFSDGADDLSVMVEEARKRHFTTVGISDHVRSSTAWLPEYVGAVDDARRHVSFPIWCGVESKILDTEGTLDLPGDIDGVDYVLIADHQVPTPHGPVHPDAVRERVAHGDIAAAEVISMILDATVAAAEAAPVQPIVAHLFSVLPKIGITEMDLPIRRLADFATRLKDSGAWVEINEKWRCPSYTMAMLLDRAGVPIVAGSDSHSVDAVGRYDYVLAVGGRIVGVPALAA